MAPSGAGSRYGSDGEQYELDFIYGPDSTDDDIFQVDMHSTAFGPLCF